MNYSSRITKLCHLKLSSFDNRKLKLSVRGLSGDSRRGTPLGGELLLLPIAVPLALPSEPGTGLGRLDELGVLEALSESEARPRIDIMEFVGLWSLIYDAG